MTPFETEAPENAAATNESALSAPDATPETITLDDLAAVAETPAKLEGKRVELSAKVARPGHRSDVDTALAVHLSGDGTMHGLLNKTPFVTALFPLEGEQAAQIRTLVPYQVVTVTGTLRHASDNFWQVQDATLSKVEADPAIVVTATELTQAFITDEAAAKEKYDKKPLRISGKVLGKPAEFGAYLAVNIVGATNAKGEVTVVVAQFWPEHLVIMDRFEAREEDAVAKLLPFADGDDIELTGVLQFGSFGNGLEGRPAIALEAYLSTWPPK